MNKQEMKFWARVFENAPNMSSEIMQGWIENPEALKKLLAGLVPPRVHLDKMILHRCPGNAVVVHEFFDDSRGILMSNYFRTEILSHASKRRMSTGDSTLAYAKLLKDARDTQLNYELPKEYAFENLDIFLVKLARMIDDQWTGDEGGLLECHEVNVFYVRVRTQIRVVLVSRDSEEGVWGCRACPPGTVLMGSGTRIFSAMIP